MVRACRAHGVDVYVDVVINHMAGGQLQDPPRRGRASTPWQYRSTSGPLDVVQKSLHLFGICMVTAR